MKLKFSFQSDRLPDVIVVCTTIIVVVAILAARFV